MTTEYNFNLKKNILFVLYNDFQANSAMHVHNFANQLTLLGYDCVVAVPKNKDLADEIHQQRLYGVTEFSEIDRLQNCFYNGTGPDIVHAWTPREVVRLYCAALRELYDFALFVHLEDNEEHILQKYLGYAPAELIRRQINIPADFSHPVRYHEFLASAQGVTVIMERLKEFVPAHVPTLVVWPGVDARQFAPGPPDRELMTRLGIPFNTTILCYTGNVHPANQIEVRSLYLAVALLNRKGHPTTLVRTGLDFCPFLGADDHWARQYAVELGYVEHKLIASLLKLAHVLVQPGKAGAFNDYRFPSKLPEFLATGKPVILPASNLAHYLHSGEEAIVLPVVDALHIVEVVEQLAADPTLVARLSAGAVCFARQHLDWERNSEKLLKFYRQNLQLSANLNS